jgi:hypothetical protein
MRENRFFILMYPVDQSGLGTILHVIAYIRQVRVCLERPF